MIITDLKNRLKMYFFPTFLKFSSNVIPPRPPVGRWAAETSKSIKGDTTWKFEKHCPIVQVDRLWILTFLKRVVLGISMPSGVEKRQVTLAFDVISISMERWVFEHCNAHVPRKGSFMFWWHPVRNQSCTLNKPKEEIRKEVSALDGEIMANFPWRLENYVHKDRHHLTDIIFHKLDLISNAK